MNFIKKILYSILPESLYLKVLQKSFYVLYDIGYLKKNKSFKFHYAIQPWIKPEFTVIDIGANLGYFAKNFARLTPKGKVICIEPVPLFNQRLKKLLGKYKHVEILKCALGKENGVVKMVMPKSNGVIRTGLPHITSKTEYQTQEKEIIEVSMKDSFTFFNSLTKIDYIKCDVEGYEREIFENISTIILKHKPFIQIELSTQNRQFFFQFFNELNYVQYGIVDFNLIQEFGEQKEDGDFLFIPKSKIDRQGNPIWK